MLIRFNTSWFPPLLLKYQGKFMSKNAEITKKAQKKYDVALSKSLCGR